MNLATVEKIERDGSTVRITMTAPTPLPEDAIPATLLDPAGTPIPRVEVHKLVEERNGTVVTETYDWQGPLPEVGRVYGLGEWFTRDQLDALLDLDAVWTFETYPDNGDHDHCLVTWTTIAAYGDFERMGYRSAHGWITVAAYEEYIRGDRLRRRRR